MTNLKSRAYLAIRAKSEGVFRILVVGDSMTYGHGVGVSEALPAQLERMLNRNVWGVYFDVINCGQDGLGLHDLLPLILVHGRFYNPDLVLLVLCDNDALLGNETGDYLARVAKSWEEGTVAMRHFRLAFDRMDNDTARLGLPVEVAFYYQRDNDLRKRCVGVISDLCKLHGFGFTDISAEFSGGIADLDWDRFRVSPADAHPSPYAHNLAARAAARRLFSAGRFPTEMTKGESTVVSQGVKQAAESISAGVPLAWAISRLCVMLRDKYWCGIRLSLSDGKRIGDVQWNQITADADLLTAWSMRLLAWRGLLRCSDDLLRNVSEHLHFLDCKLMATERDLAICDGTHQDEPLSPAESPSGKFGEQGVLGQLRCWGQRLDNWLETMREVRLFMTSLPTQAESLLAPLAAHVIAEHRAIQIALERHWDDAREILGGYSELVSSYYRKATAQRSESIYREDFIALSKISKLLSEAETHFNECARLLLLDEARQLFTLALETCPAHTMLLVTAKSFGVERDAGLVSRVHPSAPILLSAYGTVPLVTLSEEQNLMRDGMRHTHRFELPALGLATFTIELGEQEGYIEMVEVYGREGCSRVFQRSDLEIIKPGLYRLPSFPILF